MSKDRDYLMDDDDFDIDNILADDLKIDESFTLESILAEYKGEAFVNGDRKTPSDVLADKANEIIKEITGIDNAVKPEVIEPQPEEKYEPKFEVKAPVKEEEPKFDFELPSEPKDDFVSEPEHEIQPEVAPKAEPKAEDEKKPRRGLWSRGKNAKSESDSIEPDFSELEAMFDQSPMPEKNETADLPFIFEDTAEKVHEAPEEIVPEEAVTEDSAAAETDSDVKFFENFTFKDPDEELAVPAEGIYEKTIAKGLFTNAPLGESSSDVMNQETRLFDGVMDENDSEADGDFVKTRKLGVFKSKKRRNVDDDDDLYPEDEQVDNIIVEKPEEEPADIKEEYKRFASAIPSLTIRSWIAAFLCIFMAIFTFTFEAGHDVWFGMGQNQAVITAVLTIMQLGVMLLGMDILISGFTDIVRMELSGESLLLVSCFITILDTFVMLASGKYIGGLPINLVSATAVFFALRGRKAYYTAMCDSIKMATAVANPYGVISDTSNMEDRKVLKKFIGQTNGFYRNLTQADICETSYIAAAPILITAAFVFAFLVSMANGRGTTFIHCFAIFVAMAAAYPTLSAFALPFKYTARQTKRSGGVIAGWGGVCDIEDSDGALITDEDIFPLGTVSLSGVKIFEGVSQRKAILYTSSMIIASNSGLSKVFAELLRHQGLVAKRPEAFRQYEGGVGAIINEERVFTGSSGFMNLMGIRIPEGIDTKNSVFTSVNDELIAVFTINYVPANSVQNALVSMLGTRMKMILAVRDFNMTPNMIQKKFRVSLEGVEFVSVETSYKVSENNSDEGTFASGILCREGLGPFADVIACGSMLKKIATINTIISIAGSVLGMLLMFFMCWKGAFETAKSGNIFIFLLALQMCVYLLSQLVRKGK